MFNWLVFVGALSVLPLLAGWIYFNLLLGSYVRDWVWAKSCSVNKAATVGSLTATFTMICVPLAVFLGFVT